MGYKEGSANTNGSVFVCHPTYKQPIIQYSPTRFGVFKSFLNKSFFPKVAGSKRAMTALTPANTSMQRCFSQNISVVASWLFDERHT